MSVHWLLAAKETLRAALNGSELGFEPWIQRIDDVLKNVFPEQTVIVRSYFRGYREFYGVVILFVETQPANAMTRGRFHSPGTYIVKVAFEEMREALKQEIAAWNNSRPKHLRSDSIFVSLEAFPDDVTTEALVYGDAQAGLGGLDVVSLEDAWNQSCRFGVPLPESIDRALRTLYSRMGFHFYPHAHLEPPTTYLTSNRPDLQELLNRYDENVPVENDRNKRHDARRRQLRRETTALLVDNSKYPNNTEYFADPIDVLAGLKAAGIGPEVLRGTGHGDLHGRNVQVSVTNDEVSHCAVYDYEKFNTGNFPAWDFIKLEIETAVRLLDRFGHKSNASTYVQQCLTFWRHVAERTKAFDHGSSNSSDIQLPGPEWVRLADRLVQLRLLAQEHLGKSRGRVYEWIEEYELLTAWYGCRAGLYENYEPRWTIAALVAAGVAARQLMRRQPAQTELGHRRRFIAAKKLARSNNAEDRVKGEKALAELSRSFPHVLEIQEEHSLVLIRLSRFQEAEQILNCVAQSYDHTSAEIPCRWGSLWKRRAFATKPFDHHSLEESLKWYRRATELEPTNHYPRINVATVLLILERRAESQAEATRTLECLDTDGQRDHWWMATKGEATLLEELDVSAALEWYRRASTHRECQPADRQSMRDQLIFLRPHLTERTQALVTEDKLNDIFSPPSKEST